MPWLAFALIAKGADLIMLVLAWAFILSRIVHISIHIRPNKVRWRSMAFAAGCVMILLMWVKLFLHVLTRGVAA